MDSYNWRLIFESQREYGGVYLGDHLPQCKWRFPRDTWLTRRLKEVKEKEKQDVGTSIKQDG
jgi:hypothetical protein